MHHVTGAKDCDRCEALAVHRQAEESLANEARRWVGVRLDGMRSCRSAYAGDRRPDPEAINRRSYLADGDLGEPLGDCLTAGPERLREREHQAEGASTQVDPDRLESRSGVPVAGVPTHGYVGTDGKLALDHTNRLVQETALNCDPRSFDVPRA